MEGGAQRGVGDHLFVYYQAVAFDGESMVVAVELPSADSGDGFQVQGEPRRAGVRGDVALSVVTGPDASAPRRGAVGRGSQRVAGPEDG